MGYWKLPRVLISDGGFIYADERVRCYSEQKASELVATERDQVKPVYLTFEYNDSDWMLSIHVVRTEHFADRDHFDEWVSSIDSRTKYGYEGNSEKIPIEDALKRMRVTLGVNIDYFLANQHELESILGRQVDRESLEIANHNEHVEQYGEDVRKLPVIYQELFYRLMCRMFGEPIPGESDSRDEDEVEAGYFEKALMIRDFCILDDDDYSTKATARRGDYYLALINLNL